MADTIWLLWPAALRQPSIHVSQEMIASVELDHNVWSSLVMMKQRLDRNNHTFTRDSSAANFMHTCKKCLMGKRRQRHEKWKHSNSSLMWACEYYVIYVKKCVSLHNGAIGHRIHMSMSSTTLNTVCCYLPDKTIVGVRQTKQADGAVELKSHVARRCQNTPVSLSSLGVTLDG